MKEKRFLKTTSGAYVLLGSKLYENGLEIIEKKIHCCRYYPERLAQKKIEKFDLMRCRLSSNNK
jgi:hypothetical protein